jgi:hypothetical protein
MAEVIINIIPDDAIRIFGPVGKSTEILGFFLNFLKYIIGAEITIGNETTSKVQ